jgi:putative ABC transport system permease protein
MFRNYLKVALRNLWKSKGFTAINIIGLAAGLGVCLLIVLYVTDELSYDRFNVNADRIYRLDADIYFNSTQFTASISPKPLALTLAKECPQVVQMCRINGENDILIKKGGDWIRDKHLTFADSTFFKVFSIPMVTGDPNTALNEPNSVVIDESAARRYFNSTDVIGKTLEMENKTLCKVTGVMKDFPRQSHFHLSFIRPIRDANHGDDDQWLSNNWHSFILVRPDVNRAFLQSRVNATVDKYVGRQLQQMLHASADDLAKSGGHFIYHLMPLEDIHLHSNKGYEMEPNGNISYIYIFSFIAILIMVIACVNFMNLSTARSANRAKEVGIRKVAGSTKAHLITQFLTESVLLSFFSLLLALGIALLLLPMFNQLAGKELHAGSLFSVRFLSLLVILVFLVGCLAGSYPAFYLSSFQPIMVLKGKIASGFKGSALRSILVVTQFVISIGLIVSTIVIYNQLNYIRNREVGFDRDQVLIIHNAYLAGDPIKTFRKELTQMTGVADATLSGDLPTQGSGYDQEGWFRTPDLDAKGAVVLTNLYVDEHYVPTLGMKIVKGRNFSIDFPTDSTGILLNESAVQLLGWKDPIGHLFYRPGDSMKSVAYHVVGVVKDFNFSSMHDKVGPLVINMGDNRGSMAVRLRSGNIVAAQNQIESKWKAMANGVPFSYTFMDDDFNQLYQSEKQTGQLFISFAVFAILIACLGLLGLVTYAAEQRTKEIGIRKVLGASVSGIVGLLSKDFALLIGIAAFIAFPLAWWAMYKWLQTFAYRTSIAWWIFLVAGFAALGIALLTVSIQTIRAAVANPVKSLRSE